MWQDWHFLYLVWNIKSWNFKQGHCWAGKIQESDSKLYPGFLCGCHCIWCCKYDLSLSLIYWSLKVVFQVSFTSQCHLEKFLLRVPTHEELVLVSTYFVKSNWMILKFISFLIIIGFVFNGWWISPIIFGSFLWYRQAIIPKHFQMDWRGSHRAGKWCYHCTCWKQNRSCR